MSRAAPSAAVPASSAGARRLDGDDRLRQPGQPPCQRLVVGPEPGGAHRGPDHRVDLLRLGGHRQIRLAAHVEASAAVTRVHGGGRESAGGRPASAGRALSRRHSSKPLMSGRSTSMSATSGRAPLRSRTSSSTSASEPLATGNDLVTGAAQHGAHGVPTGRHIVHDQHGRVCPLAVDVHLPAFGHTGGADRVRGLPHQGNALSGDPGEYRHSAPRNGETRPFSPEEEDLTIGSAPAACTGCSAYAVPARAPTVCSCALGVALKTTTRSPSSIVITPGVSSLPDSGKESFDCTCPAVDSEKTLSVVRIRSRSGTRPSCPRSAGIPP